MQSTTLLAATDTSGPSNLRRGSPDIAGAPEASRQAPVKVPAARHPANFKRAVLAALILLAGAVLTRWAYHWWTAGRFSESTDDAYVGGNVTTIAPEVAGFIARVAVEDNQRVRAGDLLVQLDDRDYRAALAQADASVTMQQAVIANLDATRHSHGAVIDQARAELASVDAETRRSRDDQVRFQRLLETHAISTQAFQQADTDYRRALAAGEKARAAVDAAERYLEVIATQKSQAEAALRHAIALRESARLDLGYTELRAPVDGIVGNRSAQVGSYAAAGSRLISLVPTHGLWIDANFKEDQIAGMHPGSPAAVRIDSIPGRTFKARVASISPATGAQFSVLPPENATGNFTRIVQRLAVRIVLEDEGPVSGQLRPGLSVRAEVDTRPTGTTAP